MAEVYYNFPKARFEKELKNGFIFCYDCSAKISNNLASFVFLTFYSTNNSKPPTTVIICPECHKNKNS